MNIEILKKKTWLLITINECGEIISYSNTAKEFLKRIALDDIDYNIVYNRLYGQPDTILKAIFINYNIENQIIAVENIEKLKLWVTEVEMKDFINVLIDLKNNGSLDLLKSLPDTFVRDLLSNTGISTQKKLQLINSIKPLETKTEDLEYLLYTKTSNSKFWDSYYYYDIIADIQSENLFSLFFRLKKSGCTIFNLLYNRDNIIQLLKMYKTNSNLLWFHDYLQHNILSNPNEIINYIPVNPKKVLELLIKIKRKAGVELEILYILNAVSYNERFVKKLDWLISKRAEDWFIELAHKDVTEAIAFMYEYNDVLKKMEEYPELKRDDFLKYVLLNNKKRFLSLLLNGNIDISEFNELKYILAKEEVIKCFNLNELNDAQIRKIIKCHWFSHYDASLLINANYNFQELSVLNDIMMIDNDRVRNKINYLFHKLMANLSSDHAVIRMRQFLPIADYKYLFDVNEEEIANKLITQDIYALKKQLFSFNVCNALLTKSLSYNNDIVKNLKILSTDVEVKFFLEHYEICKEGIEKGLLQFSQIDNDVQRLKKTLNFDDSFYEKYNRETNRFFMNGSAPIANAYLRVLRKEISLEKYKIIVKAAMSGLLDKLRYYENDLEKECKISLSDTIISEWTHDAEKEQSAHNGSLTIYEDTSFNGIMNMGIYPYETCMSYLTGQYYQCLMSYFDANKKICYISKNGEIVGRAVIRLTKMTFDKVIKQSSKLSFTDVTEVSESKEIKERTVIFLEKLYTNHTDNSELELKKAIVEFVYEKCVRAGIDMVMPCNYYSRCSEGFDKKVMGIYITQSRAGSQYLDSYNGEYGNDDTYDKKEDQYIYSECFIKGISN